MGQLAVALIVKLWLFLDAIDAERDWPQLCIGF
jgi:hypothetical protein